MNVAVYLEFSQNISVSLLQLNAYSVLDIS